MSSSNNSDHPPSNGTNGFHATTDPLTDNSESDGSVSDSDDDASSVVQIEQDEFPGYFSERGGRLFHASTSPYPLPVDTPEQERMTALHNVLRTFFGANYVGPVRQLLDNSDRGMVLDLCTGNGKWVMEMALEFPRIRFRAFDIVPIATRYPHENVQFEIDDVNTNFRWNAATFDLVHARSIVMAVQNYQQTLHEVNRVLRPGGLFISCEWSPYPSFDPSFQNDRDLARDAPASRRFYNALNAALQTRGLQPITSQIPTLLQNAGGFDEIVSTEYHIPIGAWPADQTLRNIGIMCLAATERYSDSVKPLLLQCGWSEAQVNTLNADFIREIRTVGGLTSVLCVVHARKAQTVVDR